MSVSPPSYGIELHSEGTRYRETEDSRLRSITEQPRTSLADFVTDYAVAWTLLVKSCHKILLDGHSLYKEAVENNVLDEFLSQERTHGHVQALRKIYVLSHLVLLSAQHMGLLALVDDLAVCCTNCKDVWTTSKLGSNDHTLQSIAGGNEFELLNTVEKALVQCPRTLEWSEGLEAFTLVPLSLLNGYPVEKWIRGRPCLVAVANVWLKTISSVPPELD